MKSHPVEVEQGDCLELLAGIGSGQVELVYIDPPFFTQKNHQMVTRDGGFEYSFGDLWASHEEYSKFLYDRLVEVKRVLAPRGSVFFHCDRRASHIVRALLDSCFGEENFRSEIIWHYRRWSNSARSLLPAHQNILYYSVTDEYTFNPIKVDYSPSTNVDQLLQNRTRDGRNKSVYDRDDSGQVVSAKPKKGVPLGDVWDIPLLNPKAKERVGYPTQKPVLLLERIIELATEPGGLVVDPFCGSGTTLVAAMLLGRRAIGFDESADAVALAKSRIENPVKTDSNLMKVGREAYRTDASEVDRALAEIAHARVQRNKWIDAILDRQYCDAPVPIRIQREGEDLGEVMRGIAKVGAKRQARLMFVVARERGAALFLEQIPAGVVVVDSIGHQVDSAFESGPV